MIRFAILLGVLALYGCQSTIDGAAEEPEARNVAGSLADEEAVIAELGLPSRIEYDGGDRILVYRGRRIEGVNWGLQISIVPLLMFGHTHTARDLVRVRIRPDGTVAGSTYRSGVRRLRDDTFPFGD